MGANAQCGVTVIIITIKGVVYKQVFILIYYDIVLFLTLSWKNIVKQFCRVDAWTTARMSQNCASGKHVSHRQVYLKQQHRLALTGFKRLVFFTYSSIAASRYTQLLQFAFVSAVQLLLASCHETWTHTVTHTLDLHAKFQTKAVKVVGAFFFLADQTECPALQKLRKKHVTCLWGNQAEATLNESLSGTFSTSMLRGNSDCTNMHHLKIMNPIPAGRDPSLFVQTHTRPCYSDLFTRAALTSVCLGCSKAQRKIFTCVFINFKDFHKARGQVQESQEEKSKVQLCGENCAA